VKNFIFSLTVNFISNRKAKPAKGFLISRTENAADLPLPSRATPESAGLDLYANISENVLISPGERRLIPTGIKIALPRGYEAQIRPRSGLSHKFGVTMVNAPGTVDSDYRGELHVNLINLGSEPYTIQRGDRVAQMVICQVTMAEFKESPDLPSSIRGEGGYGHTGR